MTAEPLVACLDVDYRADGAVAAGVWFRGWAAEVAEFEAVACQSEVAEYEPGFFYRRELPCLLNLLKQGPKADIVVVDGYVWLGDGVMGLGAHLHAEIGGVVIGVAKTRFASATAALEVLHGGSASPLFVSAVGVDVGAAAACVRAMHGPFRLPTLLKRVDSLARLSPFVVGPIPPAEEG